VIDILKDLNEEQRKAVECTKGPSLVIAGAGSGKTRVLTYRVAHLLNLGIDSFNILALTFTNKAAREMKNRIIDLVGTSDARNVWMGTFHSIFARVLRIDGHRLGYPSNFTIYDTEDSKRVLRNLIKDNNLDDKVYAPGYILHRISAAKTSLISSLEYNESPELREYDSSAGKPFTGQLYLQYQARLVRASAMDFDDLLFNMNILLRDFPDVLYKYQQKFKYILVDEYQDTNYAQYLIVKKLAANNENICVVGDDAQSIYAFRGANIQNILNFKSDYPDLQIFKLEQNYRSTKTIVAAANSLILNNKQQIFKEIWTDNDEGSKITLIRSSTDGEESNLVSQSIFENKMNNQLPNTAFSILYRTNAQSRSLEDALRRMNIPCRIYGGQSFYQRKEIKDLLAYFRLTVNPKDEDALLRVINYPARGIGKTTVEKLIVASDEYKKSIYEILEDPASYPVHLTEGTSAKLTSFITMIRSFSVQLQTKPAFDLAKHIATSSGLLKEMYEDKTPEGVSRFENIEELLNAIKEFTEKKNTPPIEPLPVNGLPPGESVSQPVDDSGPRTLDGFMQDIALLTDQDTSDSENQDRVTLMTIHAAKGLEFPFVYVVGMEENLFPSIQSMSSRDDLEEERRLFYVAITRAQQKLTLSYAENRYKWGNLVSNEPSRFLQEIPEKHIDHIEKPMSRQASFRSDDNFSSILAGKAPVREKPVNLKNFQRLKSIPTEPVPSNNSGEGIQVGMEVEHDRFGKGKVISLEGTGPNTKATVFFPGVGQKQLLLRFARLKIV
jgi:DNA helicase II / ATP-dependent DNA helicase PcrA